MSGKAREAARQPAHAASAGAAKREGANAASLAPPAYGIDLVDRPRTPSFDTPVVQRAVGYEAEIGAASVRAIPDALPAPTMRKGATLWTGAGYRATMDELEAGFDLEFIIDPIDDRFPGGRAQAGRVLAAVAEDWRQLEAADAGVHPATDFHADATAGLSVRVPDAAQAAQFQATAGLSLDALHSVLSGAAMTAMVAADRADETERAQYLGGSGGAADLNIWRPVRDSMPDLLAALQLPANTPTNHLASIVTLMVTIPVMSHGNVGAPYPKGFAGPLLARTDFATMIGLLTPTVRAAIRTRANAWTRHLLRLVQSVLAGRHAATNIRANTPVFRPGSLQGDAANPPPDFQNRLNIHDWYKDLAARGEDRLTKADYRARHPDFAEDAEHLESLGGFGALMDPGSYAVTPPSLLETVTGLASIVVGLIGTATGEEGGVQAVAGAGLAAVGADAIVGGARVEAVRDRPIFEFRALSGAVHAAELEEAGLTLWDLVDRAHGRPQGTVRGGASRLWNYLGSALSG